MNIWDKMKKASKNKLKKSVLIESGKTESGNEYEIWRHEIETDSPKEPKKKINMEMVKKSSTWEQIKKKMDAKKKKARLIKDE